VTIPLDAATLRALIADLPDCTTCHAPAMHEHGPHNETWFACDEHKEPGNDCNEMPHAPLLRALLAVLKGEE
jgi:hypothetical protein